MIDENNKQLTDYERAVISMRGDGRFKSDREMIGCCALGLAEESAEVAQAVYYNHVGPVLNELGDVAWYATTAAHRLDTTLTQLRALSVHAPGLGTDDSIRGMSTAAGQFAGRVKKWLYHDKPLNRDDALRDLALVLTRAEQIADTYGRTLEDAFAENLAKLRKRFPSGGFTTAEANARADEKGGA